MATAAVSSALQSRLRPYREVVPPPSTPLTPSKCLALAPLEDFARCYWYCLELSRLRQYILRSAPDLQHFTTNTTGTSSLLEALSLYSSVEADVLRKRLGADVLSESNHVLEAFVNTYGVQVSVLRFPEPEPVEIALVPISGTPQRSAQFVYFESIDRWGLLSTVKPFDAELHKKVQATFSEVQRALQVHRSQVSAVDMQTFSGLQAALGQERSYRIAITGRMGQGKSTLVNQLLGSDFLPYAAEGKSVTLCPTEVSYANTDAYEINLTYFTLEDWHSELRALWSILHPMDLDHPPEKDAITNAAAKLRQIYQIADYDKLTSMSLHEFVLPAEASAILGTSRVERCTTAQQVYRTLLQHLGRPKKKDTPDLSSFVKAVRVSGPFGLLPPNVVLVDMPGLNDLDLVRSRITREMRASCDAYWIVCQIGRICHEDTVHDLLREASARKIVRNGKLDCTVIIGTFSDVLGGSVQQFLDNQGVEDDEERELLSEGTTLKLCRNERVIADFKQQYLEEQLARLRVRDGLAKATQAAADDAEDVDVIRQLPWFTVSPLETANPTWDCQIPALRNFMTHQAATRHDAFFSELRIRLHEFLQSLFMRATSHKVADEGAVQFFTQLVSQFGESHQSAVNVSVLKLNAKYEEFKAAIKEEAHKAAQQHAALRWRTLNPSTVAAAARNQAGLFNRNLAQQLVAPMEAAVTHRWLQFFTHFMRRLLEGYNATFEKYFGEMDEAIMASPQYRGFTPPPQIRKELSTVVQSRLADIYQQIRSEQEEVQDLEQLVQHHLQNMYERAAQAAQAEGTDRMLEILRSYSPEEAVCLDLINDHVDRIVKGVREGLTGLQGFVMEQVTAKYIPRLHAAVPRTSEEEEYVNSVLHLLLTHFVTEYSEEQLVHLRKAVKEAGYREPPAGPMWCPVCDMGEGDGDNPCDFYCSPCGHALCSNCFPQLRQVNSQRHRLCPSCRAPILAHIRIPGTPLRTAEAPTPGASPSTEEDPAERWRRQMEELAARGFDPLQFLPNLFRFNGNVDYVVLHPF
eukprot:TRINITY_DN3854_c0_g1_i1.p1 TRINITY_DN3854_c0_g1~~TRINITY_DN3854_c0_g1_i1.p1  ORF type:complete len:1031 (+),score=174.63 TRINITY_DN3854_c0_g1_i1:534-3626(+)